MRLCWGLQCICMVAHAMTSSAGHAEDGIEVQKADLGAQAADGAAAPILGTPASAKPGQRCLCLSVYLQVVHWNGSDGDLGICYGLSHCMLTGRSEDSLSAVADRLNEGSEAFGLKPRHRQVVRTRRSMLRLTVLQVQSCFWCRQCLIGVCHPD